MLHKRVQGFYCHLSGSRDQDSVPFLGLTGPFGAIATGAQCSLMDILKIHTHDLY